MSSPARCRPGSLVSKWHCDREWKRRISFGIVSTTGDGWFTMFDSVCGRERSSGELLRRSARHLLPSESSDRETEWKVFYVLEVY